MGGPLRVFVLVPREVSVRPCLDTGLRQPCSPWYAQNTVQIMLLLVQLHRFVLHGSLLLQEHFISFRSSGGARAVFI